MTRDTLCLEELEPRILLSSDGLLPIDDVSAMEARESTVVHDVVEVSALNPDLLAPLGAGDVIDEMFDSEADDLFAGASDLENEDPLIIETGEVLTGSGDFPGIENHGMLSPGNSPGVQNLPTFTQGENGSTLIEIGGTGGAGAANGHDQINVAGLAQLDGTLEIDLLPGYDPAAGDSFTVLTWGSREGEIDSWLGTASIPGHPDLAFEANYGANSLTLQVVQTPSIIPVVEGALNSGLSTLSNLANLLDGFDAFATSIPLIGDDLGNIVDMGSAVNDVIRAQINSLLASLPRQSLVTSEIESWDGDTVAGFDVNVLGVLGNYGTLGTDPVWWDVKLELVPAAVNKVLQEVTGAVLNTVFDPNPSVSVQGSLIIDFSFGYDSGFFVGIDEITAAATVNVTGMSGFEFDLAPPGGPVSLDVVDGSVTLNASVTASPDDSVLTGGRITLATLSSLGGSVPLGDAFNLEKAGSLDASFTLDGAIAGPAIDYTGTHTILIQMADLFSGEDPDLTIEIDGSLEVLGQTLEGNFVIKKTATETIIEASDVALDLNVAGAVQVLRAENGSGKFILLGDHLAGTATLTITEGPDLPNVDISGTTLTLEFNSSAGPVGTIDGVAVNLPAGPDFYRISGHVTLAMTVPIVAISGDFVFSPVDPTPAAPNSGDEEVHVAVTGLALDFNLGGSDLLSVTNGSGVLVFTQDGVAAEIGQADVVLGVPDLNLTGDFAIEFNDTGSAVNRVVSVTGSNVVIDVDAGPYLAVAAKSAELTIGEFELSGDFYFEQKETEDEQEVITILAQNVEFDLGSGLGDLISITNGSASLILTDDGVAGVGSVTLNLGVPDVGLSGTFNLRINTNEALVDETVVIGGVSVPINVPPGPYLRLSSNDLTLTVLGLSITGDFTVEQKETQDGDEVVTIEAADVHFDFGTNLVELTNGEALFILVDGGLAGRGRIDAAVNAFGESFVQPFTWDFNNTGQAIDELIPNDESSLGGAAFEPLAVDDVLDELNLPAGPYNRLSSEGPVSFEIDGPTGPLAITAEVVLTLVDDSPDYVTVGVSNLSAVLSAGPVSLDISNGTGAFLINQGGIAGKVEIGAVALAGVPGVGVTTTGLRLEFNTTGAAVDESVVIAEDPDVTVELAFTDAYYHDFLGVRGTADIEIASIVTLSGAFLFEKSAAHPNHLIVSAEDLHFSLIAGSLEVLSFHNGSGAFVIGNGGIAGVADLEFESGLVGVSGQIQLELNTNGTAVNTNVPTPSGARTINLAANQFRVCVEGHLLLGSVSLPFDFCISRDSGTGNIEIEEMGSGTTLVTITPTGAITTSLSFSDFGRPGPFEFVSMLRQLGDWIGAFRDSDIFEIEIPFTNGVTLGDAFDWSQLFLDKIFSQMVSYEMQSSLLRGPGPFSGNIVDGKLKLQLGTEAPVEVTVNGTYGTNGAVHDLDELAARFNTGFANAGIGGRVEARRNKDDQFVIALVPDEIAKGTTLKLIDYNDTLEAILGFGPNDGTYGDSTDVTPERVAVETARYGTEEFLEELGDILGFPVNYNVAQRVYTYTVNETESYNTPDLPFDFDYELGPVGEATLSGALDLIATVGFHFTLGFDLGAGETPRILSSPLIPVPANGRISADAHFAVFLNDDLTPIELTLPAAATSTNQDIEDLEDDLNAVFAGASWNGTPLDQILVAQKAANGLAISALNEVDTNNNGVLEDAEDLNDDNDRDSQLGLVNRIVIRSAKTDTFATELGFGSEPLDADNNPATTNDQYLLSGASSKIKGLFIEDVGFDASLTITTPTPISGSLKFGFVEISTSGGVVGTVEYDGVTPNPLTATIELSDEGSGDSRFYISELFGGLGSQNIGEMIDGPDFGGSVLLRLDNISVGGLGFSFPLGSNPELSIWIPDVNDLEYNPEPYNGSNTGVFLTYPDLGALPNFESINFTQIIRAIEVIADNLSQLSAFSFLDEPLPFVNISVNDMIDYASKFAELIDAAANGGADSLQETITELEQQIETLFDLDPSILGISIDTNGLSGNPLFAGGVNNATHSTALFNPTGQNNGIRFSSVSLAAAAALNGARVRVVGASGVSGSSARASWDSESRLLTLEINPGKTTANAIISAVNGLAGSPISASLITPDSGGANSGLGVIVTTALRFEFDFLTGYADSLPFDLSLADLVSRIAGDNTAARDFLEAATSLVQVSGSGELTVSASAALKLHFGLDLTNPSTIKPFFYDTTGIELTAKVLGRNLEVEASLGAVLGIFIVDGEITLDRDGDPDTDAGDGDKGAEFRLGLVDNNGDGRHYFDESWFDGDSIDLSLDAGLSAELPIFAPAMGLPLGGDEDDNGDGIPDNHLVINIPDLVRLFDNDRASGNTAVLEFAGANNDLRVVSNTNQNYEVEIVHNPATAPGASYGSGKLVLTINSGVISASDLLNRIILVPGFGSSALTATDNGAGNNGTGKLNKMTIITPDFGELFDNLDLCALIDSQAGALLDGLDSFLGSIQDGLNEIVFSTELPLIGSGLAGAANFVEDFRNGLLAELREALDNANGSATTAIENAIKNAFWISLGPDGLDLLVDFESGDPLDVSLGYGQLDVTLDCDTGLVVNLRLAKSIALVDTTENPIDFDIGVPGFGLEVSGNVVVELGFDLKLGFGLNKEDGFYINSSAPASSPELRIFFEATIPGLSASGELFFLQLDVTDDPDAPSFFNGQFVVDLKDPNNDGKLTFTEMTSSGTQFEDIISANLEATADVNLDLSASFGGNTAFPRVVGEFHLDWHWDLEDGAQDPEIAFTNIALDLGTFISDFLGPILKEIRKVTEPLDPIIEIVTTPLPVLSDLAGKPITLLDLAEIFGLLEPSTVDFIQSVLQVIDLINELEGIGEGSILIPFGSFMLGQDENGQMTDINPLGNLSSIDLGAAINEATGPGATTTYKQQTAGFASNVGSLDNFSIPIFDNPTELFNIFIGKPVRLVEWRMPQFKFEFTYTQKIPIYPPLYAQFGGSIGATIDIGFGYDTFGIQKFIESEDKNPIDILDGFYVIDFDANGNERPELSLTGEIFAGASIDLLIVEAGVRGGITATIDFDLNDVVDDGRVRVSEIIANAMQDPRCIFDIHGRLGLFLEAFLYIDLFFFSIDKEWRFADITLFEFSIFCPEPKLADLSGGTLTLNVGDRANLREEIDTTDNAETFKVTHIDGTAGNETVEVQWGNYKKEFSGVAKVVVLDAGQGNDTLDFRGVLSEVEVHGGVGDDVIYLGDGANSVAYGDEGNDTIVAGAGTGVVLYGGDGNDNFTPGAAAIEIHGGGGNDTIPGTSEGDSLFGDGGADYIDGKGGNDLIEGGDGNDEIDGGAGIDIIKGGAGADTLRGSRDDDIIEGGDGVDLIYGGAGNDFLVGGEGSDKIYGHGGIDLLIGDDYGTVNGGAVSAANVSSILLGIQTSGVSVEGITGAGNDFLIGGGNIDVLFGGDGDDFLYGGNFMANGETEVIEEDANDFFDGGAGNDQIFGDDALGRAGDRDTGISIKSSIWFDLNFDGLRDATETGFGGVSVELVKASDHTPIATEITAADGTFEFVGLDPLNYYIRFSLPAGMSFTTRYAGDAEDADEDSNDSDADNTGKTETFNVGFDETEVNVAAGYTGPSRVSIDDISINEGNTGLAQAAFTIVLSGPQLLPVEIQYRTTNQTATSASGDFEFTTGVVTFNPGEVSKAVTVNVNSDTTYEPHEQFELTILRAQIMDAVPVNLVVTNSQILATIINDDPIPQISIEDSVPEMIDHDDNYLTAPIGDEGEIQRFLITLSNPSYHSITVEYRVDAALAFNGLEVENAARPFGLYILAEADFIPGAGGTITFQPGEVRKEIQIIALDDTVDEHEEHFFVDLYNPTYARIGDSRGYGIIPDDDEPVSVTIVPVTPIGGAFHTEVSEGNSGLVLVDFEVKLSEASGKAVTVTWATSPGTALEAVPSGVVDVIDYIGAPNSSTPESLKSLVFAPGETVKTISVEVQGDNINEPDEIFFVNLLSADNAVIARDAPAESNHVTVEILNDDGVATVDNGPWSIYLGSSSYTIQEPESGTATLEITVRRTPGSSHAVAVLYTQNGTAQSPNDYTEIFREIIYFGANETSRTVEITVKSDAVTEGDETFHIFLRNPTGGPVRAEPSHAVVTIQDDDAPEITVYPPLLFGSPDGFGIEEGSGGGTALKYFIVTLDRPAGPGGVTVDYQTVSMTARAGEDFNSVSGSLFIPANDTTGFIGVPVIRDNNPELSETVALRLSSPVGGVFAEPQDRVAIATIYDDDLVAVTGQVFYDSNNNGFRDINEKGIQGVDVEISYFLNGVKQTVPIVTNASGIYTANVTLGQLNLVVDGESVTSPYQPFIFLGSGSEYDLTTNNDTQTAAFDGAVGISPFEDVGYKNSFSFSFPTGSKDTGRGGTDDMIFGGPGDDVIDAGAGDDFVVGGHWMNATDGNAPINLGTYDAEVTATTTSLHSVYDDGPIFSVDTSGLPAGGTIAGEIWLDNNNNNQQGAGDALFLDEVVVNLYDDQGNHVNALVTTNGLYEFSGLFLKAGGSKYVVEFVRPDGFTYVSPGIGSGTTNSDAINGGRTSVITLAQGTPTAGSVDVGLRPDDTVPTSGSGNFEFDDPSYSVIESIDAGYVTLVIVRGDSSEGRSVVIRTRDGAGADAALEGVNYTSLVAILYFDVGETVKTINIPIIDTGDIEFTETLHFFVDLYTPTGRHLDTTLVYIYGDGAGNISDDDVIDGNDNWDVIIADSGTIAPTVVSPDPSSYGGITYAGGPGKDVVNGGNGPDFIDGQIGNDWLAGNEGQDYVRAGMGNDTIIAELDDDDIYGDHGSDTVISTRDVAIIDLDTVNPTEAVLYHRDSNGGLLSTFELFDIETVKLFGGYQKNTFDITGWNGSAHIMGGGGIDTLIVTNDSSFMILKDASALESLFFELFHGYSKDASISLPDDVTYHIGAVEKITLIGGASANILNASGFSRDATLIGLGGDDTLIGGSGDDTFTYDADVAGLGTDTITGNGGRDTIDFAQTSADVTLDLAILNPSVQNVTANLKLRLVDLIENATGGLGDDQLFGNDLNNVLIGGAGDDALAGRAGSETYRFDTDTQWGNETVTENAADAGNDILDFSGTTTRSIEINLGVLGASQAVNDNLNLTINGEGLEVVLGGSLADVLRGNSSDNILRGFGGNDLLDGNSGDDLLDGGAGNDELDGGSGSDRISETANTNFTLTNTQLMRGNGEVDQLSSIERADLRGGPSSNTFTLTEWTGTGSVHGGDGVTPNVDTVVVAADTDFVLTDASLQIGANTISLIGIESAVLHGGAGDNTLDAAAFSGTAVLRGGEGGDTLIGGTGPDVLDGGTGNDSLTGGPGNDIITGGAGTDSLIEARNASFVITNSALVTDPVAAGANETDALSGIEIADLTGGGADNEFDVSGWTSGSITVRGSGGSDSVRVNVAGQVTLTNTGVTFTGVAGTIAFDSIEEALLVGSSGDDLLDASSFSGFADLIGGAGDDVLEAGIGDSILTGGPGDDRLIVNQNGASHQVTIIGGSGIDTLDLSDFTSGVSINLGTLAVFQAVAAGELQLRLTTVDIENLIGGQGADMLVGNALENRITGGGGNDTIDGGGATDTVVEASDSNMTLTNGSLQIGAAVDTLISIESATLSGGTGGSTISAAGFSGSATLNGGAGDDVLVGGSGGDILTGGAGNDILRGGDGNDTYRFDADTALGSDTIDELAGAAAGADLLDFSLTTTSGIGIDLAITSQQTINSNLQITLTAGNSIENVIGTELADIIRGNSVRNIVVGGLGVDTLDGRFGQDTLYETRDADFLVEDDRITIGGEVENIAMFEVFILLGGDGNNVMDASLLTTGVVSLNGFGGADILTGGSRNDFLAGHDGNDLLYGGSGNDTLVGGNGDDILNGGVDSTFAPMGDNDTLRGGAGNDAYVFDKTAPPGLTAPLGTDTVIELAGEGFNDVLQGAGASGTTVNLFETDPQILTPTFTLILQNFAQVENSFE